MTVRKIAVVSGKGGVGKTTLSANLGSVMSHVLNRDVIMVDTDISSSHLGMHMGFHYNPATVNSVLRGEHDAEESIYEHETGVKVVPGALNYEDVQDVDVHSLQEIVAEYEDMTDIVLLDCSPGLDRHTASALRSCDTVIYVARPSFTSIVDVVRTQSMVDEIGSDSLGVVLNMVKGRNHEINRSDVENFTGMDVIAEIPYDEKVEESSAQGTPVTVYDPHSPASRALEDLAIDILGEDPAKRRDSVVRKMREFLPRL